MVGGKSMFVERQRLVSVPSQSFKIPSLWLPAIELLRHLDILNGVIGTLEELWHEVSGAARRKIRCLEFF